MLNFPRSSVAVFAILFSLLMGEAFLVPAVSYAQSPVAGRVAKKVSYVHDVKPILSNHCFRCHGPDEANRHGGSEGVRLDHRDAVTGDQGGVVAIHPGKPDESPLIERIIATDDSLVMPPPEAGGRLTAAQIAVLKQWIAEGAEYAPHWSYTKPVRPDVPKSGDGWVRTPVDEFVLDRLKAAGLRPQRDADKLTLMRRVSLDLTGLPPTVEEIQAYLADSSVDAYEQYVDRLLASPAYGEHWARRWLDLARYADSAGYADDPLRTIWPYRDYVVDAYNRNLPFDRFTIEQLAGDLLPNATRDQKIATGFHRNTLTNNEGGTNDEEFRNVAIVDRVNTTYAVWLGTTMACAQCHTHKYDPITQAEYFQSFAIFNNTADADKRDESPLVSWFTESQEQERTELQNQLASLDRRLETLTDDQQPGFREWTAGWTKRAAPLVLVPREIRRSSGGAIRRDGEDIVADQPATTDTYELVYDWPAGQPVAGLTLATLADAHLPNQGPGHGGGNFVVTGVHATLAARTHRWKGVRRVRVSLPGADRILSLAEVQVLSGETNAALAGSAQQSSEDYGGKASYAIDGNTDGDYKGNSVTHTRLSRDPWWEVTLCDPVEVDEIRLWNRRDGNLQGRLSGAIVEVLDGEGKVLGRHVVEKGPDEFVCMTARDPQEVEWSLASADFSQQGFPAMSLVDELSGNNRKPRRSASKGSGKEGWAIAPQQGRDHDLQLVAQQSVSSPGEGELKVVIEQQSPYVNHVLGRFRVMFSTDPQAVAYAALPAEVRKVLDQPEDQRPDKARAALVRQYLSVLDSMQPVRDEREKANTQLNSMKPQTTPVMVELEGASRRVTKIQLRGNFMDLGEVVGPGTPAAFPPMTAIVDEKGIVDRLAFAKWLMSEENPLTARVIANRYWEDLFGTGLVATSEEFGSQGELPSHPELLDYLATELHAKKWDLKAFLKGLVMSSVYRQDSTIDAGRMAGDPDNRLLSRGPRVRLAAEMVRDSALCASGLLSRKMGGPPVRPLQPDLGLSAAFGGNTDWKTSEGEDGHRRSLYTQWRRSNPYPSMMTFDATNREVCTVKRVPTNTPLQALVTLNDPVFLEASRVLAKRTLAAGHETDNARLQDIGLSVLTRPFQPPEIERLKKLLAEAKQGFAADPAHTVAFLKECQEKEPAHAGNADLAAWTVVCNVVMNLDEALMKR